MEPLLLQTRLSPRERFAGRTLGVATRHGKERVIGPALAARLGLAEVRAIAELDTDRFGAFSGEVPRPGGALETALAKARAGAALSGLDLVVASEGTFAPHPEAPFLSCDEELLALVDLRDGARFEHRHVSLDAVFGGERCVSLAEVEALARRLEFPQHQLVLRPTRRWRPGDVVVKGVGGAAELAQAAASLLAAHGECWVESDLRAFANPTRMRVIARAAAEFAEELSHACPACGAAWFRAAETSGGLPCALCGEPTRAPRFLIRECRSCGATRTEPRSDGRTAEDPRHCAHCNP